MICGNWSCWRGRSTRAWRRRSAAQEPAFLARYAFELAQAFNMFYHKHHILSEEDAEKRAFLLRLTALVREQLGVSAAGLLGD